MTLPLATLNDQKRAAALAAVGEICDGMLVGLGTGSTAAFAIEAVAQRLRAGLKVQAVATSEATWAHAGSMGNPLLRLETVATVDLCIDGVDEIDRGLQAIKGAGGAMLREKVVASAARRMVAIGDSSKAVTALGARPVPVEVLPVACAFVASRLSSLGCEPILREGTDGSAVRTDQGNLILDCHVDGLDDPARLAAGMDAVPGLLGHGLFLSEIDALYLATTRGVVRTERPC